MADIIDFDVLYKESATRKAEARLRGELIAQLGDRSELIVESAEGSRVITRFVEAVQALTVADQSVGAAVARVMAANVPALEYHAAKLALDTVLVQFTRDPLGLLQYPLDGLK